MEATHKSLIEHSGMEPPCKKCGCSAVCGTDCRELKNFNAMLVAIAGFKSQHDELLAALEEMYSHCNMSPDNAPHRVKARQAIAKAKGGQ